MHTRQSGAAHVPIMFFLILLIMFLGALVFAYVAMDKNGQLEQNTAKAQDEVKALTGRNLLLSHLVEDLNRVIEKGGSYAGRPEASESYAGQSLANVNGVISPADMKKVLDDFCAAIGVAPARGLEGVLGAATTRVAALNQRIKDAEDARTAAMTEKTEVDSKFQRATADAASKASEYKTNTDQIRATFEAANNDKQTQINSLQQNLRDKVGQMEAAAETAKKREDSLTNDNSRLRMHNSALVARDQLRNVPDVADGKVLAARSGVTTAYINLGRKDMLQNGTVFRVRNPHSDAVKALATVVRTEQEQAEVELSQIADALGDPVRDGDLLYNELYTPGVSRRIYLMGRFTYPYNKPELEKLLKNLGNVVVAKMGPGVDTVILGNDAVNEAGDGFAAVTESQEYKDALDLRVEFVALKKISDLIKL